LRQTRRSSTPRTTGRFPLALAINSMAYGFIKSIMSARPNDASLRLRQRLRSVELIATSSQTEFFSDECQSDN
jgi:hypothetical protein